MLADSLSCSCHAGRNIVHLLFISLDKRGLMFTSDGISLSVDLCKTSPKETLRPERKQHTL